VWPAKHSFRKLKKKRKVDISHLPFTEE